MSTTDTALAVVETMTAVQLFQPGTMDPVLERIKAESRARAAELDISKESDRKALASLAYQIARSKTFIEARRVELVADEKKRLAAIDAEGRRVREELDALKDEIRKPLTEYEQREKDRIARHEADITKAKADRRNAEIIAEQNRKAAEQRAEHEKQQAVERERQRVAAAEEAKRKEQERREADREHRRKVNSEALKALMAGGVPHDHAVTALTLIAQGRVPAVKLTY